jgi:hypothetical protein
VSLGVFLKENDMVVAVGIAAVYIVVVLVRFIQAYVSLPRA